jgi:hypothetical protein
MIKTELDKGYFIRAPRVAEDAVCLHVNLVFIQNPFAATQFPLAQCCN